MQQHRIGKRLLSLILTFAMMSGLVAVSAATAEPGGGSSGSYVLDADMLTTFGENTKTDGETETVGNFFTILWSAKSKVESKGKSFTDNYSNANRINFGGGVNIQKNSVRFTTDGAATVKIWWGAGNNDRQMGILDSSGTQVAVTNVTSVKDSLYISELSLENGGTYYLGGAGNNNYIHKVEVIPAAQTYTLDADMVTTFGENTKTDGETETVGNFFTILWSAKSKVESKGKSFTDNYSNANRINFGGGVNIQKNSVRFTTDGAATVKIWWGAGNNDRQMGILDSSGTQVAVTNVTSVKDSLYISELSLENGGTYYLGGAGNNNYIHKVEVTTGAQEKPPRAEWDTVDAPVITSAAVNANDAHQILVAVDANVGYDGADKVTVTMTNASGAAVDAKSSAKETDSHTLTFTPAASGTYTFTAALERAEEENKAAAETKSVDFTLPLEQPYIKVCANAGSGSALLEWDAIAEAEGYEVSAEGIAPITVTECTATVTGLTVGQTYTFSVVALRGEDRSEAGTAELTVTQDAESVWSFSAFGTGVTLSTNGYEGSYRDGAVRVYSTGGKGKLVPASTDGLAFYYTKIDPNTQNFKLTATANVNSWQYSNGQEGFGLMAADAVGKNGDSDTFWNNSYMTSVTKVEYTAENGNKYTMKLGVGSQEKIGVETANINEAKQLDDMSVYSSVMKTLETSVSDAGEPAGTYNLVSRYANASAPDGTLDSATDRFILSLEKNNTGYFLSYTDPAGVTHTNKYYDTEALSHLDEDTVYVGFFASRYADVTFTDIEFVTSDPANDAPAEERPTTTVNTSYQVVSASIANKSAYTLTYYGNADGTLTVADANEKSLYSGKVSAGQKLNIPVTLSSGDNRFTLTMTPDETFKPSEYEVLSSYQPSTFGFSVRYEVNAGKVVYAAPNGTADAAGTKEDPQSIEAAVARAVPGQTILLMEGTYAMSDKLVIERGIDGTQYENIRLEADPEATSRPVLDFGQNSAGLVLAGNYWHLTGFDVTNTKNGEKGIQVSGNYNTLELMETYKNGNTGIQIARYMGSDDRADWPHDNLILNCTSYLNADKGYEDADGFAAKLTIGEGNVFDGCIACYNADDGWDLYAKIENGAIGKVVIKNSVAYKNGYILDDAGAQVNAGNGNGFKMGGESIPGHHTLINSVAFANKAKGIDSNSCPDIEAYQSTSFDNEANNVAFYTNTAVNTGFVAEGVLSYKKTNSVAENLKPVGNQDIAKIKNETNYYLDGGKFVNTAGEEVTDDWFVSLDTDAVLAGGIVKNGGEPVVLGTITRNDDGSVNLGDYLKLTDKAPANVGARLENVTQDKPHEEEKPVSRPSSSSSSSTPTVTETVTKDEQGNVTGVTVNVARATDSVIELKQADADTTLTVNAPAGSSVRLSVPVKNAKPGLVAVRVNPDGSETVIRDSVLTKDGLLFPVKGSETVKLVDNAKQFTDLGSDPELAEAADYLSARDVFRGTTETQFAPEQTLSRGMIVTLLYRLADEPAVKSAATFSDAASGTWYSDAVSWAQEAGIANGDGTSFHPDDALTQEQLAAFLFRYARFSGTDVSKRAALDAEGVSDWARDALAWAVAEGLIEQPAPAAVIDRGECAAVLLRLCKLMAR